MLDELLEDPAAKVVVFSQWLGTHELIRRRLGSARQRDWGHVLFHGGVPGDKRGALVERFHDDPNCRLFLSTDAGGVGLNLQHAAAVVVNMDLPWNPAVLEQRIGRVHRMGQSRGVQVINFVGQGSIEEGMLSVLAFKKSLFAGVLDGGESEVFLQGTKLSQFMKSVEQVAGAMGEADVDPEEAPPSAPGAARTPADPASTQGDALPIAEPPDRSSDRQRQRAPKRPTRGPQCSKRAPRCCRGWRRRVRPAVPHPVRRPSQSNATRSRARPACACPCPNRRCCSAWPRPWSPGCATDGYRDKPS